MSAADMREGLIGEVLDALRERIGRLAYDSLVREDDHAYALCRLVLARPDVMGDIAAEVIADHGPRRRPTLTLIRGGK